ncbi:MAG TPA: M20/M25/M40 family metallo-hydrolase [Candidatus Acidoferrales bacterium]|nr:M20/M25/M40 family metallo-hydrolase [Candidatus Acidoferrales bacterium]
MARGTPRMVLTIFVGALACAFPLWAQSHPLPAPPAQPASAASPSSSIVGMENEAISWLQGLVRINTTNPPGNELNAAKYLAAILEREGIHAEVFESTPGRGFLVARLSSSAVPDPSRALLLMGHLDVVGVDRSKWKVEPFSGVIQDGYLYGRGAIDDKSMTIANLAVFIALKRSGARLDRDVIFLAEGDEEAGGASGMTFAVEKHWDKIAAGFALNEGGRVLEKNGKVEYVGVQVSEKVAVNVDVIASGTSGHASVPLKDNPITHLANAMSKISTYEAPVQFNSVTRAYFDGLAPLEDEETGKWIRALQSSDRADHAARWISDANPTWNAMLRDTVTPTMLQAGIRENVVPSEARGVINVRLLPGNMIDALVAKLQQMVNDPQVKLEIEPGGGEAAPSSSLSSDLYASITRVAGKDFPSAPVLPYMSTSATDSIPLRMRDVQAYGLLPFPMTQDDLSRMHGDNERIQLDNFRKGLEFLSGVVVDFVVAK